MMERIYIRLWRAAGSLLGPRLIDFGPAWVEDGHLRASAVFLLWWIRFNNERLIYS